MSIQNSKITGYAKSIKSLADTPKMTAAELKSWFDGRTDEEVKTAINNMVDELIGPGSAGQLGAEPIDGLAGNTVQVLLEELWTQLKDRVAAVRQEALGEIARVEDESDTAIQTLDNAAAKKENTYTKEETNTVISNAVGVLDAEFTIEMEALDNATAKKTDTYTKNEVDEEIDTKIERRVVEIGAGDMRKAVYGGSADGVVADSDKLGGLPAANYVTAEAADDALNGKADIFHADADPAKYGIGSPERFGHLKLSDETDSWDDTTCGVAATPLAVKNTYDVAVAAQNTATSAQTTATSAQTTATSAQNTANAAQTTANAAIPRSQFGVGLSGSTLTLSVLGW